MDRAIASLAEEVVSRLTSSGQTLGAAESCTGGLFGATITSVSGASAVFCGSAVTYTEHVKEKVLSVSRSTLEHFGAVSDPCAGEMAQGARTLLDVDFAVSFTGYAGPSGGTREDPVGTVYIGLSDKSGTQTQRYAFCGTRDEVRQSAVKAALELLISSL